MKILNRITIAQIRAARPRMIFYGARTCWWTHDQAHVYKHPQHGLPCDPRGGVLYQTDDVEGFLRAAEANPAHFGRHGLRTFIATHHLNCVVSETDQRPTCGTTFEEYNALLDAEPVQEGKTE